MNYVDPKNSQHRSTGDYTEVLHKIIDDGVCPFCPSHLTKYHKRPLVEKKFWWVTDNMYPYSPVKHHRLLIHKEHISHASELGTEAWMEAQQILNEETGSLNIKGGTLIMRFGETRFTGGSVSHLHAHITQSDPDHESYDPKKGLTMRIG